MKPDWLDRYRVIRRLAIGWVMWLITYATLQVFAHPETLSGGAAAAYATVVGMLSVVLGVYFHDRFQEDKRGKHD